MSPRLPPKISMKHDWKRELGSEVARQPEVEVSRPPEREVARPAKFFQPHQPTPNPIRDRSVRLDHMQDGRNTSRSRKINVNSFFEELSSSDRSEWLGITHDVISLQACSSEDSKSLNVEQTHDRSGRPGKDSCITRRHWCISWGRNAQHWQQWDNSWKNWGRHELPNSKTTTYLRETRAEYQRSTTDSENWEPPKSTCSSTRDLRQSQSFNPFSQESKTNDSWSCEERIVRITRHGTRNAVQSMFILLGRWHRLLHVRALLAKRNRG